MNGQDISRAIKTRELGIRIDQKKSLRCIIKSALFKAKRNLGIDRQVALLKF